MKAKELIERLKEFHPEMEVVISKEDGNMIEFEKVKGAQPIQIVLSEKYGPHALGKCFMNGHKLHDPEFAQRPDKEKKTETCILIHH
jgi:hypothetical protein